MKLMFYWDYRTFMLLFCWEHNLCWHACWKRQLNISMSWTILPPKLLSLPLNSPQIWRVYFVSVWRSCSLSFNDLQLTTGLFTQYLMRSWLFVDIYCKHTWVVRPYISAVIWSDIHFHWPIVYYQTLFLYVHWSHTLTRWIKHNVHYRQTWDILNMYI